MVDVRRLIDGIIFKEPGEKIKDGRVVVTLPVDKVVIHTEGGWNNMQTQANNIRSSWANGLFYLFVFVVVISTLGFLARKVGFHVLALIIIAGIVFVPLIGALQLRQDQRLSEKSFIELMKMVIRQIPLISDFAKKAK
jgi:internalin A